MPARVSAALAAIYTRKTGISNAKAGAGDWRYRVIRGKYCGFFAGCGARPEPLPMLKNVTFVFFPMRHGE